MGHPHKSMNGGAGCWLPTIHYSLLTELRYWGRQKWARLRVTSSLSHSWWFHSPLSCICHSPGLSCSHVTQYQPRRLKGKMTRGLSGIREKWAWGGSFFLPVLALILLIPLFLLSCKNVMLELWQSSYNHEGRHTEDGWAEKQKDFGSFILEPLKELQDSFPKYLLINEITDVFVV